MDFFIPTQLISTKLLNKLGALLYKVCLNGLNHILLHGELIFEY